MVDCRFSGAEAVFTLEFPMFRTREFTFSPVPAQVRNRKLVLMAPKFRKNYEMHGIYMLIFHVCEDRAGRKTRRYASIPKNGATAHILDGENVDPRQFFH